ncbi:probable S-adenosylmethionine-dependent methyltransferase At5g38780 [Pomacea canaliculata]|uniref:probable S-adenosylmethionine-dependent methyltransferase At5g38780 n=1 Tax=Pomacea canaliculata TaxID=400727 RepID=UPI000D72D84C|nr:probable S-adenosylmethionine-dependent methyltransferase At5g38780 [Pomacea canaliculata]
MSAGTRTPYFQHFWKPGSGYYSESLGRTTKGATDICEDFVLSHIDSVPVPSPKGVFTIGDYGTCDGSVSLRLMHRIIGHLRNKHGPDLKIQVLYEDLPTNDYNSLFKTIYGSTSYIHKFDNVFPLACGTSFYKQCVPDNSCDIIMSSFATHWLSDRSHAMSSTMSPWMSTSEEEMKAHHEASARDWQTFLLLRATELKQGGLLFVAQPSQNTKSSPAQPGEITECARDTWIHLNLTWKELYAGDIITREEFQSCNVPATFRSLQELKAPFENAATMSPVRQAGLNLFKEPEVFVLPCFSKTMWRQKLQSGGADDRTMFAQNLSDTFRVILEPALRRSLHTRQFEEQLAIVEQYFKRFIRNVATLDPETFQSEICVGRLVAQKLY